MTASRLMSMTITSSQPAERCPVGGRMIPWTGNPFQGAGGVNPVFTGTRTEGLHGVPLQDQSVIARHRHQWRRRARSPAPRCEQQWISRCQRSHGPVRSDAKHQPGRGRYDGAAQLLSVLTHRLLPDRRSRLLGPGGGLNSPAQLDNIGFSATASPAAAMMMAWPSVRMRETAITSARSAPSMILATFSARRRGSWSSRNPIRRRNARACRRNRCALTMFMGLADYDLSMGDGHLQYEIEFDFYNR